MTTFRRCLLPSLLLLAHLLPAQSTYRLHWGRETALVGAGAGLWLTGAKLGQRTPLLTEAQVLQLDAQTISGFDRWATRQNSHPARRASDILLLSSPTWPSLLFLDPEVRRQAPEIGVITGEAVLLTGGLTQLTKNLARRTRPYVYHPQVPMAEKRSLDARRSFFSGHTSVLAASTFVSAKIWTDVHPHSRMKPVVWAGAVALPLTMGWLRVRGGRHFPTDVLTGLAVGGLVGWLVPELHR
ncbi:MAG TPA: phosphatase PAP2 family protein [Saprospiraceae bacterium]|nr:phosphatase PAP2 family protein [Saprospiraceae bacterium]